MATSLQTLIPLISSLALLLTLANTAQSLKVTPSLLFPSKSTSFSYDFSQKKPGSGLTYQGDAYFPSDTKVLRLTKTDDWGNAMSLSVGRVVYTKPVIFSQKKKQASFKTTVKFIIRPSRGDEDVPADGLVFFIAPVNSTIGESGGSFGVFDHSGNNPTVFAVEFDIFVNEDFDPSYRHVGIDIQSQISKNVTEVNDGLIGQEVTALIAYDATTKLISVHGTAGAKNFEVSYVYDLTTILPKQVQVGISAATGGAVAIHDVISWSFSSNIVHVK